MFSEDHIKDILEVKEKLALEIQKHKEEIETLEKNLALINSMLKEQSFTKASSIKSTKMETPKADYSIPLKKNTDGSIIGNAHITPDQVMIVLDNTLNLNEDMHPFKSFFLERIIGEMKRKDIAELEKGTITENAIINCLINKNGSSLREIIIKNYRQKERVNEIISTATWSFSKMIENSK